MTSAWNAADACILAAEAPGEPGAVLISGEQVPTVRGRERPSERMTRFWILIVPIPRHRAQRAPRRCFNVVKLPDVPEHYLLADADFCSIARRPGRSSAGSPRIRTSA